MSSDECLDDPHRYRDAIAGTRRSVARSFALLLQGFFFFLPFFSLSLLLLLPHVIGVGWVGPGTSGSMVDNGWRVGRVGLPPQSDSARM